MWLLVALSLLIPSSPGETSSFAGVDSDGDGMIEPEEIQELGAALGVRRGDRHDARPMRMRADADASGAVSPAELRRGACRCRGNQKIGLWLLPVLLYTYCSYCCMLTVLTYICSCRNKSYFVLPNGGAL